MQSMGREIDLGLMFLLSDMLWNETKDVQRLYAQINVEQQHMSYITSNEFNVGRVSALT